jgi:sugar phosphate isomerase/epimerase
MRRMGIGLQLYTLRDETAADFPGTLRQAAEMGYEGVEFAGYAGIQADEMKEILENLGLTAIGSHVGLQKLRDNLQGEIDYVKTIGGRYLICPYVGEEERKTPEDWKRLFSFFEKVGMAAGKEGLTFAYHNHAFEFDQQVDGAFAFDAMYANTSPESVQVEMDVCWVQFAGQDPIEYIRKYVGRLPLLHLKDFSRDAQNKIVTLELGQGQVALKEVIAASSEAGVEWLIVEQDNCQNPPLQSVSNSLHWLKRNYLQQLS